jgi:hypothetical protein
MPMLLLRALAALRVERDLDAESVFATLRAYAVKLLKLL